MVLESVNKALKDGAVILDSLAGHGKILEIRDAEYILKYQNLWERILNKPHRVIDIKLKYLCSGAGKPFESFGTIKPKEKILI
jgi:hypothetical protein